MNTLRCWSLLDDYLKHEHESGKSYLKLYDKKNNLKKTWNYKGFPTVKIKDNKIKKLSFETYRGLSIKAGNRPDLHYYVSSAPKFIVLSLHGGPESIELDEKRYGGWYEDVVKAGGAVAVWNYPGSIGFGDKHCKRPHKKWLQVLNSDLKSILREIQTTYNLKNENIILFGPSFGGTLALALAPQKKFLGRLAINPLINIEDQMKKARNSGEYSWFLKRFGNNPEGFFNSEKRSREFILLSSHDEVISPRFTQNFAQQRHSELRILKGFWHTPRSKTTETKLRRELTHALKKMIK